MNTLKTEPNMKITDIKIVRAGRYLFIKVCTDKGITGIGEAGAWSYPDATIGAIEKFASNLIGQDPMPIEHHWQTMYRSTYFRGAVIMSAISAIDIALWDIKGKALGVPIYELLGGKCRDRVRSYAPVFEFETEKMAAGCVELKKKGFTAARLMLTDSWTGDLMPLEESIYSNRVNKAIEKVKKCREAVGDDFDLCLEVHRSMNPAEAMTFSKGVEAYHPMFIEDPIPPDNYRAMGELAKRTSVPIATGERYINIQEFEQLLSYGGASYVRPDLCALGGITASKKVATIAESHYVSIAPHNPLGPISTAACLQLDACIPNFGIQEFPSFYENGGESDMMMKPFEVEKGCIIISDKPGLGIELIPDLEEVFPVNYKRQNFMVLTAFDGSVRDL